MNIKSLLAVILLALASASYADSPSSAAARDGVNPSTVRGSGDFDFSSRDRGRHSGWDRGEGHGDRDQHGKGGGHRNHDCNDDGPLACPDGFILINGQCLPLV
ncbi:MAG: hypothetical protein HZA62_14805 [Rhodocyclales bacterium]|nr:hypothetical protein [Rhodocyclales bacterium]